MITEHIYHAVPRSQKLEIQPILSSRFTFPRTTGASVEQAKEDMTTPLFVASEDGRLEACAKSCLLDIIPSTILP